MKDAAALESMSLQVKPIRGCIRDRIEMLFVIWSLLPTRAFILLCNTSMYNSELFFWGNMVLFFLGPGPAQYKVILSAQTE